MDRPLFAGTRPGLGRCALLRCAALAAAFVPALAFALLPEPLRVKIAQVAQLSLILPSSPRGVGLYQPGRLRSSGK